MQSVLRRLSLAALLALSLCAWGASPGPAAAATAHPRIFLTPATLEGLRVRASAGDADWKALRARCDEYRADKVEYPDGEDFTSDSSGIGEGYQGISYFAALLNVGLCYQVALGIDPAAAARYGAVGVSVLQHMSAPKGDPHYQDPDRDRGYGVRFYGTGMAIGYDWFYPALTPALRAQLTESIQTWLATFENEGYSNDFPQGNYFAGYYAAKAYAGLALSGDSPVGDQILADWQHRVQGEMVQPYSAANLSGGGWPEGWNYGPLGSTNMSLPAVAAKTALGVDLVHDPAHPFVYPVANPRYLLYFTWPSMKTLDDADKTYDGPNPTETSGSFFSTEAGVLRAFDDPFAPYFASFAAKVRELEPTRGEEGLWENFLFWDPSAPQTSYTKLPRSYLAKGVEGAAVRSDWSTHAVWGTFKSGPYTNAPEVWEHFDEGSLAIVNGNVPFLVNAPGALMRETPGTPPGREFEEKVESDIFLGDPANRDLFNVFYVDSPTPWGQTAKLRSEGARTQMSGFHDGGSYVAMNGTHLEDMYQGTVKSWSRSVLYLRPGVFVVYDRTKVSDPKIGQWMAFHFGGQPTPVKKGAGAGVKRYDVNGPEGYAGTVDTVLPRRHKDTTEGLFGSSKVVRLEIRPGHPGTSQQWLTVFDAAKAAKSAAKVSPLKAKGEHAGLLLRRGHGQEAVLLGGHNAKRVSYRLPGGRTANLVSGLKPGASYKVSVHAGRVTVSLGKGKAADSTGTLAFTTGSKKKKKPKG